MEQKFNDLSVYAWMAFTGFLVAALAVNGVCALAGKSAFAWWQLWTLGFCCLMTAAEWAEAPLRMKMPLLRLMARARIKAAKSFSYIHREVRGLSSLLKADAEHTREAVQ